MYRIYSTVILAFFCGALFAQNPYPKIFKDKSLTSLKSGVNEAELEAIPEKGIQELAIALLNDSYETAFRYKEYEAFLKPQILAKKLKTSPYSQYENPTGIYFKEGDTIQIWINNPKNHKLNLRIANWDDKDFKQSDYTLKDGYNEFVAKNKGNAYVQYFTEEETSHPNLSAHIISGNINGVFDIEKHDNQDWNKLLESAAGPVLDLKGKKVALAYSVESLKKYSNGKGVELLELYDTIVTIQHDIMGLKLEDSEPKNRMFGRVIWEGFMHADGIGAAFHDNTMKELANAERLKKNPWGVAHEFGHVNQVRPDMKWVGMTEVSNNIYSVWTQYLFNKDQPKLEREKLQDYDEPKIGGRITSYMESAFINKQPYLTQAGPDRWERERPRDWGGDHFVKLVPLWQLQLYFNIAGEGNDWENKDFYPEIYSKAINAQRSKEKDAYYQLQFVKNAIDVAKLDLTDFFEKSGLLRPIDLLVDDYTVAQMTITQEDIDEVKKYASNYPKPETPVLHYLTANSVAIYKNKEKLSGKKKKGFDKKEDRLIIDNKKWPGAVAFETYQGKKLVKVAFRGAGSEDASETIVHTPEKTTTVKAVGWNGKRKKVR